MDSFQNSDGSFLLYTLCHNHKRTSEPIYPEILQKCVQKGAHVNDKNSKGNSCLHIAAFTGNTVAVKFLLNNKAFPNSINKWVIVYIYIQCQIQSIIYNNLICSFGLSELHFAVLNVPSIDIVSDLVKSGADITYKLKTGLNVSEFAEKYGKKNFYTILHSKDLVQGISY